MGEVAKNFLGVFKIRLLSCCAGRCRQLHSRWDLERPAWIEMKTLSLGLNPGNSFLCSLMHPGAAHAPKQDRVPCFSSVPLTRSQGDACAAYAGHLQILTSLPLRPVPSSCALRAPSGGLALYSSEDLQLSQSQKSKTDMPPQCAALEALRLE